MSESSDVEDTRSLDWAGVDMSVTPGPSTRDWQGGVHAMLMQRIEVLSMGEYLQRMICGRRDAVGASKSGVI